MHKLMCIVLYAVVIALCRAIRVVCVHDVSMIAIGVEGDDQDEKEPSHHHVAPGMSLPHKPSHDSPEPATLAIDEWHALVSEFSQRKLTVLSDRLPAISGLANAFGAALDRPTASYYYGMWRETIRYDLYWTRKTTSVETQNLTTVVHRNADVPTFSWASIADPVRFFRYLDVPLLLCNAELLLVSIGSITMRGLMFDASSLAEEYDHPFDNGKDGPRIAKIWDAACLYDVDSQRRLGVECLCFGIFERADWDVPLEKEEHTM
jgi:hypothetical protein